MPIYQYACPCKKKPIEVEHSMSFIGNELKLPGDVLKKIKCEKHGIMQRIPFLPNLAGSSGGTFKSEKQLLKEKQQSRKLRSKIHFKNEVLPKLSGTDRMHFEKKLKNIPKKDHEKIK